MKAPLRFLIICCVLCLTGIQIYAQTGTVSAAGEATGPGGTISSSIGQVNYITTTGSGGTIVQGLQQPYEIVVLSGGDESISLYPNPTVVEFVTLKILSNKVGTFSYDILDLQGKHLTGKNVETIETIIPMTEFNVATYIVKVLRNNKEIKTFKVVKNQ